VFVVVHTTSHAPEMLPQILRFAGRLPADPVTDGEAIERGRIYVAPPDRHLLVDRERVLVRRGPRENRARPAIDPLFRAAAAHFGSRVVGVVLTGHLNDGTAGLRAIKRCGGTAVVQDPADAVAPEMPRSALAQVAVDHCVPLSEMAALLIRLVGEPAGPTPEVPPDVRREAAIAAEEVQPIVDDREQGAPSIFTCPDCHGTLWEILDGDLVRYRCHVGHAYTRSVLASAQWDAVEQALWSALRGHEERAELLRRMKEDVEGGNRPAFAAQLRGRIADVEKDVAAIRTILSNAAAPLPEYNR
jgi:two-component system chemotaxis response regulator CheB